MADALAHPESVTNWWPIAVLSLLWIFREVMSFLKTKGPEGKKDISPLIENQTHLLEEQKQTLTKISSILDLVTEKVLEMNTDIAIIKDRRQKERD